MNYPIRTTVFAAATFALALPAMADTIGQPLLVAEADTSGSLLDFFGAFGPSGIKEVSVSGMVTEEFGTTGFVGTELGLKTTVVGAFIGAVLTIGGTTLDVLDITVPGGAFDFDPFQSTPGVISYTMVAFLPVESATDVPGDPSLASFEYAAPFQDFGPMVGTFPELELAMNIYYDGAFPTQTYDDGVNPPFDYVEGPFDVTRIELGLVGGTPVGAVPLPAGLPLVATGLIALGLVRRKRTR